MISRAHKVLFALLLAVCVVMAVFLIRLRNRAQDRLQAQGNSAPQAIAEPAGSPPKTITLFVPNDLDDSMVTVQRTIPMPVDENAQARVLLESLIEAFRASDSTHPIQVQKGVDDVFFVPVPQARGVTEPGGQMAVVDLDGALAAAQPSGIEPETLTLLSMMATLHANLPDVTEVHFLVDGQQRETLAGHADLTRTYLAEEAEQRPIAAAPAGGGR